MPSRLARNMQGTASQGVGRDLAQNPSGLVHGGAAAPGRVLAQRGPPAIGFRGHRPRQLANGQAQQRLPLLDVVRAAQAFGSPSIHHGKCVPYQHSAFLRGQREQSDGNPLMPDQPVLLGQSMARTRSTPPQALLGLCG